MWCTHLKDTPLLYWILIWLQMFYRFHSFVNKLFVLMIPFFFGSIRIFNFKIWLQWDDNSLLSFFFSILQFTIMNLILDGVSARMVLSDFLRCHWMTMLMVHLYFDVHGILENMAQCTDWFDIQGNGIWSFVSVCVHEHQSYSNKNYNPMLVPAE